MQQARPLLGFKFWAASDESLGTRNETMKLRFWKGQDAGSGAIPMNMELPVAGTGIPAGETTPRGVPEQSAPTYDPSVGSQIRQMLADIHDRVYLNVDGALANYIPELAKVDPSSYGIAIATTKGKLHTIGDTSVAFTIQSTSKALTYCMALELCGRRNVLASDLRQPELATLHIDWKTQWAVTCVPAQNGGP